MDTRLRQHSIKLRSDELFVFVILFMFLVIVVLRFESQLVATSPSSLASHFVIITERRDFYSELAEAFDEAERIVADAHATGDFSIV